MIVQFALGLLPIAIVFLLLGFCAARIAKKHGKSPWLWGGVMVVTITVLTWQYLPRWAGILYYLELTALRSLTQDGKTIPPKLASANATTQLTLATESNTYVLRLPEAYRLGLTAHENRVGFYVRYPTMEAIPSLLGTIDPSEVSVVLTTIKSSKEPARRHMDQVAANNSRYLYVGKEGPYDVYEGRQVAPQKEPDRRFVFTAKDGHLVLVAKEGFKYRARRDLTSDLFMEYSFYPTTGDFVPIDEIVTNFVRAHLNSQPTMNKAIPK